jgi:hypothetical protein
MLIVENYRGQRSKTTSSVISQLSCLLSISMTKSYLSNQREEITGLRAHLTLRWRPLESVSQGKS